MLTVAKPPRMPYTHSCCFKSWTTRGEMPPQSSPSFVPPVLEDSGTHFGLEIGIVSPDGVGDLLSTPFRLSVFSEIALQLAVDQSHRESLA